jgi:rod shape-determining protein MreC
MNEFFLFLARSRAFLLFAVLEIFALFCVYRYNNYGSAILFNTTNTVVGKIAKTQNAAIRYTKLNSINENLVKENIQLGQELATLRHKLSAFEGQTMGLDSAMMTRYQFEYAEAINFTTSQRNNFITINKGSKHGIKPGMGVITATGIVGKVKVVSPNMSLVTSILHSENLVSSKIKRSNRLGTVKWEGLSPKEVELLYIDLFEPVSIGDTVVTSDLNKIFGGNIMIGTVKKATQKKGSQFKSITLNLSTDFNNLAYVYVIKNALIEEQVLLEQSQTQKPTK